MSPLPPLHIFEKMRGIYTPVMDIRRRVLAEVARMIVNHEPPNFIEHIPYLIINKDIPTYRESVFKERAIVRERARLAFGMDLKEFGAHGPIYDNDIGKQMVAQKVVARPIVNVIKIGCERCPTDSYFVSNLCRGCIAHPCTSVCPKNAVSIVERRSVIDQSLCIRCGKCAQVCPYNAIAFRERPCAAACGVHAIGSDERGFAEIDYTKCVSCGMCIVSCPFGAIGEKSEIVQIILALQSEKRVYAEIAPAFVSQFGPLVKPEMLMSAIKQLGFQSITEVAAGADVVIMQESQELVHLLQTDANVKSKRDFVGTSCCTAWVLAAQRNFPEIAQRNISESYAPMVETAKKIKAKDPDAVVVFIGPCIAKKEECFKPEVIKFIDFVMTFEELAAIFQAYNIDVTKITDTTPIEDASQCGRRFPVAHGVIDAVVDQTKALCKDLTDIPTISADTLADCMQMLRKIQNRSIQPYPKLVEGMGCPFGCVGGPGTLAPIARAQREAEKFAQLAKYEFPHNYLPPFSCQESTVKPSKTKKV